MDLHLGQREAPHDDGLLKPKDDVVSRPAFVISQVMVKTQFNYAPRIQKRDHFVRPIGANPALRGRSLVVQKHAQAMRAWQGSLIEMACVALAAEAKADQQVRVAMAAGPIVNSLLGHLRSQGLGKVCTNPGQLRYRRG